jgi:hypothetical protein
MLSPDCSVEPSMATFNVMMRCYIHQGAPEKVGRWKGGCSTDHCAQKEHIGGWPGRPPRGLAVLVTGMLGHTTVGTGVGPGDVSG